MQRGVWSDERGVACREGCGLMRGVAVECGTCWSGTMCGHLLRGVVIC